MTKINAMLSVAVSAMTMAGVSLADVLGTAEGVAAESFNIRDPYVLSFPDDGETLRLSVPRENSPRQPKPTVGLGCTKL